MGRLAKAVTAAAILCLGLAGAALALMDYLPRDANRARQRVVVQRLAEFKHLPARPEDAVGQRLEPIDRVAARRLNAAIPFVGGRPGPARPFRFSGSPTDRSRAEHCLALAAMAEAGASDPGQRAVIQVVLNRVRHPAFAKSICGVVFQGSERSTGCQFTFTCDGSLARRYSDAAWREARRRAGEALGGRVFAPVGSATHYHTDWVHPVWSSELEKIARIETHLFFRWPGFWGSRDAAGLAYRGDEPLFTADRAAATGGSSAAALIGAKGGAEWAAGDRLASGRIVASNPGGVAFLIRLAPRPGASGALAMGRDLCNGKNFCRVLGWIDGRAMPSGFPVPPGVPAGLSFSYMRDVTNVEQVLYDCELFRDAPRDRCLPVAARHAS